MNIIKCPNGHFYDADNNAKCPHCAKREELAEEKKRSWFGFAERKKQRQAEEERPSTMGKWEDSSGSYPSKGNSDGDYIPEDRAIGFFSTSEESIVTEVVGWLVCIKGIYRGKSFELHYGANSVGRESVNDISLPREGLISARKHFIISYEDRERNFYILPGNSGEFVYIKEKPVLEMSIINDRSVIECGSCAFMLIAFCDEEMTWENL